MMAVSFFRFLRLSAAAVLLVACDSTETTSVEDTAPTVTIETGVITTAETETTDTSLTTTTTPSLDWSDLKLSPSELTVGVGAEITYLLTATDPDGVRAVPEDAVWTSSDLAVASVIGGVTTVFDAGTTEISAKFGGMVAQANLTVDKNGSLTVTVVDLETGVPLAGAYVAVDGEKLPDLTDDKGMVVATSVGPEPISVSAFGEGMVTTMMSHLVGRRVVIGVRPKEDVENGEFTVTGTANLADMNPGISEIGVALVAPSISGSPWAWHWDDIVGRMREVSILGISVNLPKNVLIEGEIDDWELKRPSGSWAWWCMGTIMPLADALSAGNGESDAFTLISENLEQAEWGVLGGTKVSGADTSVGEVPLSTGLGETRRVYTKGRPAGTLGKEPALVLTLGARDEGFIVTGLSTGFYDVDVQTVSNPPTEAAIGIMQEEYIGSGKGSSVAVGFGDGTITLPEWLEIPRLPTLYVTDEEVRLNADVTASVVVAKVNDREQHYRDFYAPPDIERVAFEELDAPLDFGNTAWGIRIIRHDYLSYEEMAVLGPISVSSIADRINGVAIIDGEISGTE